MLQITISTTAQSEITFSLLVTSVTLHTPNPPQNPYRFELFNDIEVMNIVFVDCPRLQLDSPTKVIVRIYGIF